MSLTADRVKKKWFNHTTKEWVDYTLYRIDYDKKVHAWLSKSFAGPEYNLESGVGWSWLMNRIFMDESIYMMCQLKFGST